MKKEQQKKYIRNRNCLDAVNVWRVCGGGNIKIILKFNLINDFLCCARFLLQSASSSLQPSWNRFVWIEREEREKKMRANAFAADN